MTTTIYLGYVYGIWAAPLKEFVIGDLGICFKDEVYKDNKTFHTKIQQHSMAYEALRWWTNYGGIIDSTLAWPMPREWYIVLVAHEIYIG